MKEFCLPPWTRQIPLSFSISDGIRSPIAGMRFRQLSLETGEETANVLTRNWVRYVLFEGDCLYAFLDKRILKLRRDGLQVLETWREKVPRYTDIAVLTAPDTFLMGNHLADSLTVFNVRTTQARRKKIGGCCGIFPGAENHFLLLNYSAILEYAPENHRLRTLADTGPYQEGTIGESGRAYLLSRDPGSGSGTGSPRYQFAVWSLFPTVSLERSVLLPPEIGIRPYTHPRFRLSRDGFRAFLFDCSSVWVLSLPEIGPAVPYTFPPDSGSILDLFPDQSLILTLSSSLDKTVLPGWEICPETP